MTADCRSRIADSVRAAVKRLAIWLSDVTLAGGVVGCASSGVNVEPVYFPPPPATPHVVHLVSFNDLTDLVPAERGWTDLFRGVAPSPHVRTPAGIAFRDGRLYVCDTGANRAHRWDLQTGTTKSFGGSGEAVLVKPVDVAVDEAGNVYVADTGLGEVIAFDVDGAVVRRFRPTDRKDYRPVGVAIGDGALYVADIAAHRVDVFSTADRRMTGSFGGIGGGVGDFFYPMDVVVAADGTLFIADMMNARVQVFDAQLRPTLSFGQPGNRYGDLGKPKRLAVGPNGVVFVADVDFRHVHLFDARGRLLMLLGGPGGAAGSTPMPAGVAVARALPPRIAALVPAGFRADYFLFVTNTVGTRRISLYAIGTAP